VETFEIGRIIWAVIKDPNGFAKPDPRPAMVTQRVTVSGKDDLIPVIAGSTKVFEPIPDDQVLIHKDYHRNPTTKLKRPTVLICTWPAAVKFGDVQEVGGFIPARTALPIIKKALALREPKNE